MNKRTWSLIVLLSINATGSLLLSQILKHKEVPFVNSNNAELRFALMGGFNSIQAGEFDLNLDGTMDMVLFDRSGNVLIPMIYKNQTRQYEYAPEYKHTFPVLKDWVVFKDYNKDGLTDIFASSFNTEGVPGIEVYTTYINAGSIEFKKFVTDSGLLFKVLYFTIGGSPTNIAADFSDLLSIDDLDGDGDLDILLFEPGNNRASWFQNVVVERGYGIDTLVYVFAKRCWGGFVEDGSSSNIKLSGSKDTCVDLWKPILTNRHAGSTILSVDLNGDDLKDLIIGDLTSPGVTALYNGGTKSQAWMTSLKTDWPGAVDSVNLYEFNGAFSVDVDHDQLNDIIIAPNDPVRAENTKNVWYYRNTGTSQNPKFQLQTRDLFSSEMIDLGAGSDPCFVDYNQDGLMDILVGTEGFYIVGSNKRDARLVLFENIGTVKFPKYKLVDSNYLNFNEFALGSDPHNSFSPSFGDLDNDGDLDLLVGENYGQFFYCKNIAGKNKPFVFEKAIFPYQDLSVKAYSSPCIVDLNRDGLPDIVSGSWLNTNDSNMRPCGSFYYFQNMGTKDQPLFDLDYYKAPNSNCLGKIIVNGIGSKSYTSPEVIDFNGNYKLFSGNIYGEVKIISNIENNVQGQFKLENPNYGQLLEGERSRMSLADIDDDGILDMIVGNSRGGLAMFQTTIKTDGTTGINEEQFGDVIIFPNPSAGVLNVVNNHSSKIKVSIYNVHGVLMRQDNVNANARTEIDLGNLNSGLYFIHAGDVLMNKVFKWFKI